MRKHLLLVSFLGALLAAGPLHAQTPSPAGKEGGRPPAMKSKARDCSKASDPKACEERRAKIREAHKKAGVTQSKEGADHAPAWAADVRPGLIGWCRERETRVNSAEIIEAYKRKGTKGKEVPTGACMGEQMCAQAPDPAKCREREKQRGERKGPQK